MIEIYFPISSYSAEYFRPGYLARSRLQKKPGGRRSFHLRDVLRQNQCNRFQAASVDRDAWQMHGQHSLQLATLRDKLQKKIAHDIPCLQLATQQNVPRQGARKLEASGTFCDIARQSAACHMAPALCHATLTSTLRGTFQEMLHCVTLPLNVTTRDGTSSKSLIELVKFLDWNKSNTVAIPVASYITASSVISRESNSSKYLVNTNGYRKSKDEFVGSC